MTLLSNVSKMCDRTYRGDSCHIQSTFWESRQVQKSTTPAKFHSAITKHLLFSNTVAKSEPTLNHTITNIPHQSNHDLQLLVCVSTNGLQGKTVISRDTIRPDYQLSGLTRLTAFRLRVLSNTEVRQRPNVLTFLEGCLPQRVLAWGLTPIPVNKETWFLHGQWLLKEKCEEAHVC
jgi:hypothetical protein